MFGKYKNILFVSLVAIFVAFSANTFISHTAYADHDGACTTEEKTAGATETTDNSTGQPVTKCKTATTPGTSNAAANASADDGTTCAIEKIGWILCPIIEQSGKIGDQAFAFLSKTFLETEPELVSNTDGKGTKYAWDIAKNLANIMFIVAFLIIIYSQVTGAGITNYGIKKMLPRIIVAAIAVNASYYICQGMVDLTNILGHEVQNFLIDAARQVTQNTAMPVATGDSFQSGGGVLSKIAIGVLAIGAIVYFLLPVLGAVISLILITCLSIIIILLLRKAFIVLLIVAAPIAFVFYLLPNTEKYFQKWLSMFWKLLLVFPIVGALMGSGQLASAIILAAGVSSQGGYSDSGAKCITLPTQANTKQQTGTNPQAQSGEASVGECGPGAVPFMLGLTAAGIAVVPLLAVYAVLKGALSAAGAIGGKIGATVSNMNSGRKNNLQKRRQELGEYRSNKREVAALTGSGVIGRMNGVSRMSARRKGKYGAMREDLGAAQESYTRAARQGDKGTAAEAQEMLNNRREAYKEKINAENIAVERSGVKRQTNEANEQEAQQLINARQFDSPRLAALLEELNDSQHESFMHLASQLHQSDSNGRPIHSLATDTAAKAMGSAGIYSGSDIASMSRGEALNGGLSSAAVRNAASGGLTAASIVGAKNNALTALSNSVARHGDRGQAQAAINNANASLQQMSDSLRDNLSQDKRNNITGMGRPPAP